MVRQEERQGRRDVPSEDVGMKGAAQIAGVLTMPDAVIQLYRPSNGTQGESFICDWCGTCARDTAMNQGRPLDEADDDNRCGILGATFAYDQDHPNYPREWCYAPDGHPQCTAHIPVGQPVPPPRCPHTLELPL
jgi:hypothetical protein